MPTVQTISEIERHVAELTGPAGLMEGYPVPPGSVLRVHAYSYPNWGIRLTPDNQEWLYDQSCKAYALEWQESDSGLNVLVGQASANAQLGDVNALLNAQVAQTAIRTIQQLLGTQKHARVVDVGHGTGATSIAVFKGMEAHKIGLDENRRIDWVMVEPSAQRQLDTQDAIRQLAGTSTYFQDLLEGPRMTITYARGTDVEVLGEDGGRKADLIISNATIHHHAFNRHLDAIWHTLRDGGTFINGDWHCSLWEHPKKVYWLLQLFEHMGNERMESLILGFTRGTRKNGIHEISESPKVSAFRKYFGLFKEDVFMAFEGLTPAQRQADACLLRFWLEDGRIFKGREKRSPIFFLEAHERPAKRMEHLIKAGFLLEKDKYLDFIKPGRLGHCASVMKAAKRGPDIKRML